MEGENDPGSDLQGYRESIDTHLDYGNCHTSFEGLNHKSESDFEEDDQESEISSEQEEEIGSQVEWTSGHEINLNSHNSRPSEGEEEEDIGDGIASNGEGHQGFRLQSFDPSRSQLSTPLVTGIQNRESCSRQSTNRNESDMHATHAYPALGSQSGTAYSSIGPSAGATALDAFYGAHNPHHYRTQQHSNHHHHHPSPSYAGYAGSMYSGSMAENGSPPSQTSNFGPTANPTMAHHNQQTAINYSGYPHFPNYTHHPANYFHTPQYSQFLAAAYTNGSSGMSSTATAASSVRHPSNERLSSSVSPTYQGSTNTNSSTRPSTTNNNSSNSTNNGSPLSSDQQLYPSNNQSSVGEGHSDLPNGDQNPDNNYSPPLKTTPSSVAADMSPHPGHPFFANYPMTNGHNQIHQQPVAKKGKSGRGRGRRPPNPSPSPEQSLDRVFIWDLDETLILFTSLLSGAYCDAYYKGDYKRKSENLGGRMEELVYWLGDTYFFYSELDECDQTHVDDAAADDNGQPLDEYNFAEDRFHEAQSRHLAAPMTTLARGGVDWLRKLAFRYRKIKETFTQYRGNIEGLLGDRKVLLDTLMEQINEFTRNWPKLAKKCVETTSERERCANVLVTHTPLVPTICKVLLYGLGPHFEIDNIYSAHKVGKENIFEKLQNKYGKKCTFVVIGDGADEESAARRFNMPFWKVSSHPDLTNLHRALTDFHM